MPFMGFDLAFGKGDIGALIVAIRRKTMPQRGVRWVRQDRLAVDVGQDEGALDFTRDLCVVEMPLVGKWGDAGREDLFGHVGAETDGLIRGLSGEAGLS
jgi:hypothetical protein